MFPEEYARMLAVNDQSHANRELAQAHYRSIHDQVAVSLQQESELMHNHVRECHTHFQYRPEHVVDPFSSPISIQTIKQIEGAPELFLNKYQEMQDFICRSAILNISLLMSPGVKMRGRDMGAKRLQQDDKCQVWYYLPEERSENCIFVSSTIVPLSPYVLSREIWPEVLFPFSLVRLKMVEEYRDSKLRSWIVDVEFNIPEFYAHVPSVQRRGTFQ